MTAFSWTPSYGSQKSKKPDVLIAQFGDGYQQSTARGINSTRQSWDLRFQDRDPTELDAIEAYLDATGGYTPFLWTTPDGVELQFVCREWHRTYDAFGGQGLTATFTQDFTP